jgi:hypothetical protein
MRDLSMIEEVLGEVGFVFECSDETVSGGVEEAIGLGVEASELAD